MKTTNLASLASLLCLAACGVEPAGPEASAAPSSAESIEPISDFAALGVTLDVVAGQPTVEVRLAPDGNHVPCRVVRADLSATVNGKALKLESRGSGSRGVGGYFGSWDSAHTAQCSAPALSTVLSRADVDAQGGLRFALQDGKSTRSLVVPIVLGSLQFQPTADWEPRLRPGAEVRLSIPDLKLEGVAVYFVPEGGSLTNARGLNHALNEGELRIFVPAAMEDGQGWLVLQAGYTTVSGGELVRIALMQSLPLVVTH
jgi:hypothetical protein